MSFSNIVVGDVANSNGKQYLYKECKNEGGKAKCDTFYFIDQGTGKEVTMNKTEVDGRTWEKVLHIGGGNAKNKRKSGKSKKSKKSRKSKMVGKSKKVRKYM